jgi:DNA-binding CsgD family transcriptional regulator
LRDAVAQRRPVLVELLNFREDGRPFRNAVMVAPVIGDGGEVLFFIGSQMEIPAAGTDVHRARAQRLVAGLTPRQRQVLQCLVGGRRNKQIAAELQIGEKTVKMHRSHLLVRLGATTSADAIRIGVEAGLAG